MRFKDTEFYGKDFLVLRGEIWDLSTPRLMGILNLTTDSFYAGSRLKDGSAILQRVSLYLKEGADFIDIGAVSSRPGAGEVSEEQELDLLISAVELIRKEYPEIPISVDSYRSKVIRALHSGPGIDMINDISGGRFDAQMFETVAELQLPYVLMHMQGTPANMQVNPVYTDVCTEILQWMASRIHQLELLGVKDILVDPGFGFGKTLEHNYQLLNRLDELQLLDRPLLVGLSRKSMIWKSLDCLPAEALNGTTVLHTIALQKGASILRVHDVKEAREALTLVQNLKRFQ